MRIALVIERFDTSRGGRERSIAQIASGLARRGHEVTILCQRGRQTDETVQVRQLGAKGLWRASRLKHFVRAVQELARGADYDIVDATLPVPGCDVYEARSGTVPARVAADVWRRGPLGRLAAQAAGPLHLHRNLAARLEREVVDDPNVLCLAVSQMVAEEFKTYYGRTKNVRLIYNAVDVPDPDSADRADWRQKLRFRLGVGREDPVFLTVAMNFELKGVRESIVAFARWVDSRPGGFNPRLIVVGRHRPEGYERIAGLRSVGRLVHFVEPTDAIFEFYAAADACLLLSWYDPCSRVVLEATRWGIPSITTTFNGAAEVLAGGAGIVVSSPNDTAAVVAAFDELADPGARAERARKCLEIANSLSVDKHVDELLRAYAEVHKGS